MDRKTAKAVKRLSSRLAFLRRRAAGELAGTDAVEAVGPLLQVWSDKKEKTRQTAYRALTSLQSAAADRLCTMWSENRESRLAGLITAAGYTATGPLKLKYLTCLKQGRVKEMRGADEQGVEALLDLLSDKDEGVSTLAGEALLSLTNPAGVDRLCGFWHENRSERLKQLLLQGRYVAQNPAVLRIKTTLLQGRRPNGRLDGEVARSCLLDPEETIVTRAAAHILDSEGDSGVERIWALAKEYPEGILTRVLRQQGRYPADAAERALFYFLAGDMAEYRDLDFEQSILRLWYETAEPGLKEAIAGRIRKTGDARLLAVFRTERGSKKKTAAAGEVDLQIAIMTKNKDYDGLFDLLALATCEQGRQIIAELSAAGWQCRDSRSFELRQRLVKIFQKEWPGNAPGLCAKAIFRDFRPMFFGGEKPPENENDILTWTRDREHFRHRSAALIILAESGSPALVDAANTACGDDYWQVRMAAAAAELLRPGTLTPANRALLEQDHVYWVQALLKLSGGGRLCDLGPDGVDALQAGTTPSGPEQKPAQPDNFLDRVQSLLSSQEREYLLTLAEFLGMDVAVGEDVSVEAGAADVEVEIEEE
ncbi:MAG: hypothetical protein GXP57_09185 [Deltaproteobacteria bacterium]|nr:hypothetical protein [Deltaproteobacteria bacterium]